MSILLIRRDETRARQRQCSDIPQGKCETPHRDRERSTQKQEVRYYSSKKRENNRRNRRIICTKQNLCYNNGIDSIMTQTEQTTSLEKIATIPTADSVFSE